MVKISQHNTTMIAMIHFNIHLAVSQVFIIPGGIYRTTYNLRL